MRSLLFMLTVGTLALFAAKSQSTLLEWWKSEDHRGYKLAFTNSDVSNKTEYAALVDAGINTTQNFFNASFKSDFDVVVHPNRHSLDSTWQKEWKMPDFKSECWMVASGV